MPSANGAVGGPWSSVPLWRGLDSAFLCEPSIPKAPLTPRFQVDEVITIPKLPDNPFLSSAKPTERASAQEPEQQSSKSSQADRRPIKLLLLSAAVGFASGMLMAWWTGLLG